MVSIGEDTTCRVWEGGVATRVLAGHRGRSVWSMAVNKDNSKVVRGWLCIVMFLVTQTDIILSYIPNTEYRK